MKTWMCALVVLALLVPVSLAAAPKSLTGTWKVESFVVDGKAVVGFGDFAKGTLWKLKKDGTATVRDNSDIKWTYDADDAEFVVTTTWLFFTTAKGVYSVTSQGNDVKLKSHINGRNYEIVLTPE